jgi:hypothetical protein
VYAIDGSEECLGTRTTAKGIGNLAACCLSTLLPSASKNSSKRAFIQLLVRADYDGVR